MRDWFDVLPQEMARRQTKWERGHLIMRGRAAGLTYREIANAMGLSVERVRQIQAAVEKSERWNLKFRHARSPIERFIQEGITHDVG